MHHSAPTPKLREGMVPGDGESESLFHETSRRDTLDLCALQMFCGSRIRNLLHHHVHQLSPGPATTFWTGCGALRRVDFEAAGGFRTEDEMIEDVALGLRLARLGRPVVLDPGLQCTHLKEWTWGGFARTDYRHRAMPWTRMLRDPGNRDLAGVLNVGPWGKAAVLAVALSLLALPLRKVIQALRPGRA